MKRSMILLGSKAKALHSLSFIFMMAAFSLSSCIDLEDTNQSMVLSGEWKGDFGMYYDYVDRYGRQYTFDSYDSYLTFTPAYSYATHGRGTQVDYYDYGPYEYQYYKFSWSVSDGNIYLTYDYDHELDVCIRNYRMNNDYFSGTFSISGTSFRLRKIADYYNWAPYVSIYGYFDRTNWFCDYPWYVPFSRSGGEQQADSIASEPEVEECQGKVLSRGRRQQINL